MPFLISCVLVLLSFLFLFLLFAVYLCQQHSYNPGWVVSGWACPAKSHICLHLCICNECKFLHK